MQYQYFRLALCNQFSNLSGGGVFLTNIPSIKIHFLFTYLTLGVGDIFSIFKVGFLNLVQWVHLQIVSCTAFFNFLVLTLEMQCLLVATLVLVGTLFCCFKGNLQVK